MKARCQDTMRNDRCRLPFGHDGLHRCGDHVWGFRDERPEWVRRMKAHELPAKMYR